MKMPLRRFFGGREDEEGQALILFAILMLALLFAIGLAIDAGQLYAAKRTEQEAADAAAFAGAVVLYQGGTGAQAVQAAIDDAQTNGYVDGVNQTTVAVNWPPQSGNYQNLQHVEVIITRQVKTSLVPAEAVFNPVRARGVAGAEKLNNGYAVMALDRGSTCDAFWAQSNADMHLNGGGILVNSTSGCAAQNDQNTSSRFTVQSPYSLDVAGQATGHWADLTPPIPVNAGHAQVGDPFGGFPKPSTAGPDGIVGTADDLPICNSLAACQDGSGNQIPGVYNVTIGGNTNLTLNAGVYILRAGMDTAGNGNVTGTGLFLYNTYSTYPGNPGASPNCTSVNLQGNATFTISAQTTGTWANLLFYQDPACTVELKIGGNGTWTSTGSVYVPNGPFVFAGNNATLTGSQLIAQTVNMQNGNLTINYNPNTTAQPILPRLAE
jgi:Flp pilus assembly protein TadG